MPGITGWAQVNGRNNITWDQKFALDIWYVDNITFKLDLLIIWRTIVSLIHIRNVNKDGFEGMDVFKGGSGEGIADWPAIRHASPMGMSERAGIGADFGFGASENTRSRKTF
jgi:hypothetical protein